MRRAYQLLKTPITLLVLLGVLLYGAWWGYKSVIAPTPPAPKEPCVTQNVGNALKSSQVTVNVYNGSAERGLARKVADRLRKQGFRIGEVDNTERRVTKTIVLGAAKDNPEVQLAFKQFKKATIEVDERPDHTVDILVGRQFGGYASKAPKKIAVTNNQVCLPSPAASTTAPA